MIDVRDILLAFTMTVFLGSTASAHQFNVYASVDCEAVTVEATLENGRAPATGEVRLRDQADTVVLTEDLGATGKKRIPLSGIDTRGGLKVEVQAGDHNDYWILSPDDIARNCTS